jgi:hypothetical protein
MLTFSKHRGRLIERNEKCGSGKASNSEPTLVKKIHGSVDHFREHSVNFRERSVNFREHSVNLGDSVNFREHSVNFREHSDSFREHLDHFGDVQVEEGTKFGRMYTPGEAPLPKDDLSAEMYCMGSRILNTAG